MRMAMLAALVGMLAMAGSAVAVPVPFNDANNGNWNNAGDSRVPAADTWGTGSTAYPWSGDVATIDSNNVTMNKYAPWGGTGADWPADLTIVLDGGNLQYQGLDLGISHVYSPVQVRSASTITCTSDRAQANHHGNPLHSSITDYDGANTGKITIAGGQRELALYSGNHSGFSGGWNVQDNAIYFGGWGAAPAPGDGALGTGQVEMDGGLLQLYYNAQTLNNAFVLGANGGEIHTNYGGGVGEGRVILAGVISGPGELILSARSNYLTVSNPANSYHGLLKKDTGTATIMNPGALGNSTITVEGGTLFLDADGGSDWDLSGDDLIITGGVVQYEAGLLNVTVGSLDLGGTPIPPDPTPYDIAGDYTGVGLVDFASYFDGQGTITVGAAGDAIPEPAGLGLLGLALLTLKRRRR